MPFGPRNVAGVLASLSYAGPSASRVGASAVVARLRRSVAWSDRRLSELSTLPEASEKVVGSPTLVVDRRGLIRSVGSLLESFEDARTPKVLAAEAVILRALAKDATGIWDVRSGRRILVAPNVLADAQRYALDQTDWCRWVSLCTGLRGVHLTHAPHLVPYIADLMRSLPERSDELVRIVLLLDALPTAEMEVLTPRDLPSIQWLRTHRAHAGGVGLVRACAAAGMPLAGVEALQAQTEGFARTVVREGAIAQLLSGVEALPSAREYAEPAAWLARVRLRIPPRGCEPARPPARLLPGGARFSDLLHRRGRGPSRSRRRPVGGRGFAGAGADDD